MAFQICVIRQIRPQTKHLQIPKDTHPISSRPYRIPLHLEETTRLQLNAMLEQGVISPSDSPWSSLVILHPKKSGGYRFCIDFRRLNSLTAADKFPIPLIEDVLNALAGQRFYSTLDLGSGYWQVPMAVEDRPKTAFTINGMGHFEFNVMPFGLQNAPATFQ